MAYRNNSGHLYRIPGSVPADCYWHAHPLASFKMEEMVQNQLRSAAFACDDSYNRSCRIYSLPVRDS